MSGKLLSVFFLTFALLLAGCGSQKGRTVFTAGPDSGDNVGAAPETGTYLLYTAMSPNPTMTVKVNQGDKLGFRKTADGRIEAIYNDQVYDFDKGTTQVYWKLQ
jgi:hypothetical protein